MLMNLQRILLGMALCLGLLPPGATAAPTVGKVEHVLGTVYLQRAEGARLIVVSGATLENGDTIQTAQNAEAVLVLDDQQRIYLKARSIFRIDDFNFSAGKPETGKSFTSLVQGGLRTISGSIGKPGSQDNYQLKTRTATIGIRGTEYSVRDCGTGATRECNGIHIAVFEGRVNV